MPIFPNVPNVPGVPPLPRNPQVSLPAIIILTRDIIRLFASFGSPQWGLFLNGVSQIAADTVVSFDYKQDWHLPTAPQEQGQFMTYNKVTMPYAVRFRFASGGSEANRQALLDSVMEAANSLALFDAVTPEKEYESINISHYDYRRMALHGVGLLVVDVWCHQIRVTESGAFSSTAEPSGAAPVNGGNVQALSPTEAQTNYYEGFY